MKRLGFLLCCVSAVLTLSVAFSLLAIGPSTADPFATVLRPVIAWGPCLLLALFATCILAQPPLLRGVPGRAVAVLVLGAAFLWPAFAYAQAAAPSATEVSLGGIFSDVRGTIEAVIGAVVLGIIGLIAAAVKKNTGLSIDGKMRDTLQSAAMNGVHLGLDKVQGLADTTTIDVKSAIIADGIGYVRKFAPLAVKHFGLGEADLAEIVRAKLASLQPAETKAVAKVTGA